MIVVCGEALVDLVPGSPNGPRARQATDGPAARPGGSAANVAVGLARLGVEVQLLCRLSTDHFGEMIRQHLTASGVGLALAVTTDEPTTLARVELSATGDARYTFQVEGTTNGGWRLDELPARLPAGVALHIAGSFALGLAPMRAVVAALLEREHDERTISFDPNPRPTVAADRRAVVRTLEAWVGLTDLVKVGQADLAWTHPDQPVDQIATGWCRRGPALVVVTRGADGATGYAGAAPGVHSPARAVAVVDTVGAGDAFTAGLLAELAGTGLLTPAGLHRLTPATLAAALAFGQQVAAATCARVGADPPWRHQLPP